MPLPSGVRFVGPQNKPLSTLGAPQPLCVRKFFLPDGVTVAPVYSDALLQNAIAQPITADANGRFQPIYLDTTVIYRAQLFAAGGITQLEDANPCAVPSPFAPMVKTKAATTARANTIALADDPDLILQLPAAGTYQFEIYSEFFTAGSGGTNGGLRMAVRCGAAFVAGAMEAFVFSGDSHQGCGVQQVSSGAGVPFTSLALSGSSVNDPIVVRGVVTVSAAGQLALQWAQDTSVATATQLLIGAVMTVQQLA